MSDQREDVTPGDEAPPDASAAGENLCRECGGSGEAGGKQCEACGGTGKTTSGIGGA